MSPFELLEYTVDAVGVAHIALNRPPVNALNRHLLEEIGNAFVHAANDRATRAVVLSGKGRAFAAGADIKEIEALEPGAAVARFGATGVEAFGRIAELRKPVIAAIHGNCLGGGAELAMACHIRVASPDAMFGQPEIRLGICPGFAGTQRLPRHIGKSQALRLLLTGDAISAHEAARIGMVDVIAEEGRTALDTAMAMATTMAGYSSVVIERILDLVIEGLRLPYHQALELERNAFGDLSTHHDMREGFRAFIEKRPAVFQDK